VRGIESAPAADNKDSGRNLALRVGSALVLAPLAIATAYAGGWPFGIFWTIAAIGIWWEWNALVSESDNRLLFVLGAATLVLALAIAENGMTRIPVLIVALGALGAGVFARTDRRIWAAGGLVYAGAALIGPILLRRDAALGFAALMFLFAVVWATDVLGYFVGRALGGPKLASKISPKKTWSGAIGGALAAMVVGVGVARLADLENMFAIAAVALLLSAVAQAGDLFESTIKRRFGAKDAGHLIPGHGGLMDRLDGFTAAAVAGALFGVLRAGMDVPAQGLLLW
jgi:phosphatidate cytidylyltransferase